MGQAIGRIEILPDPLALAHHVAEWMTQAALYYDLLLASCSTSWPQYWAGLFTRFTPSRSSC